MVNGENHARREIDLGRHSRGEQTEIDHHMNYVGRREKRNQGRVTVSISSLRRTEKQLSPMPKDIHSWVEV